MPRRYEIVCILALIAMAVVGIVGVGAGAWFGAGLIVIVLGLTQFLVAPRGKVLLPFGLTEMVLNRLPERVWRVAICVVGGLVVALGVAGLVAGR